MKYFEDSRGMLDRKRLGYMVQGYLQSVNALEIVQAYT
jgi:hypothetical protein